MATEAARLSEPRPRRATLTERATLNVVSSLLDYGAKVAVGLVVVPILVAGFGRSLYGVWEMLGRLVGYMTAGDGRPTQGLRLVVSNLQGSSDDALKRRYVGAAFVVWLLFLPVIVVVGGGLVWIAPTITKAAPSAVSIVRLTCVMLVLSLLFGNLASLPESVLRGMNLGYKRMGLQASLEIVGGALVAGAVYVGLALPGAAGAQAVFAILSGVCFWWVVRKYVTWFGVSRPTRGEVRGLLGLSLWYSAGEAITKVQLASDVIVLGMVLSPAAVTSYVLTGYAARMAVNVHVLAASAATPGLGGVIGEERFDKAARLRHELLALTWLFAATVGSAILMWNRTFLSLWVGAPNYAGAWVNVLIVAIMVQTAFVRADAYVIDAALRPRLRVTVTAVAAVLTVALAALFTKLFGTIGLCAGVLAGRFVQTVAYPRLVSVSLKSTSAGRAVALLRPAVVLLALFAAAGWAGARVLASGWFGWIAGVVLTVAVVLVLAFRLGLTPDARAPLAARARDLARRLR